MATVTIRNLEPDMVRELKQQAEGNRRSLEAELRELLGEAVRRRRATRHLLAEAGRIAAMTPRRRQTDAAVLIREARKR